MSEIAEYQIDGKTYTQTFLSIEQTIQVSKILKDIKFKKGLDFDLLAILDDLIKSGKLKKLLGIVLKGDHPLDMGKLKPALLLKIIGDFFFLNDVLDIISSLSDLMSLVNQESEKIAAVTKTMTPTPTGTD